MRAEDLVGKTFSHWTVLGAAPCRRTPRGSAKAYWFCQCICGAKVEVRAEHLRGGRTTNCGCVKFENDAKRKWRHGGRRTPLYEIWTQMIQRCSNPKNSHFHMYGGRGILVCERWKDFSPFRDDVLPTYVEGLTLDRERNDEGYGPTNFRWATYTRQARNQRKTILVPWGGTLMPLADLAEEHGIGKMTAYSRYAIKGWSVAQALGVETHPRALLK